MMRFGDRAGHVASLTAALLLASFLAAAGLGADREQDNASACGNGLLDAGETCESCAADCAVAACKPGAKKAAFDVDLTVPPARKPAAAGIRLAYRSSVLSLPGEKNGAAVRARFASTPEGAFVAVNDLGYAVRVVVAKGAGFASRPLFRIELDLCEGAKGATSADLACVVEGCGSGSGQIADCSCSVSRSDER
jgi:hypothetical protein